MTALSYIPATGYTRSMKRALPVFASPSTGSTVRGRRFRSGRSLNFLNFRGDLA